MSAPRRVRGFGPSADARCTRLVLGSMPGEASLAAARYYAHPRNQFWGLIESLLGVPASLDYEQRLAALRGHGVALWDVLHSCRRTGSLDARIEDSSVVINDFGAFFDRHPGIALVLFNGARAEQLYRRHVLPVLASRAAALPLHRLPSTSPANASWSLAAKREAWRVLAQPPSGPA